MSTFEITGVGMEPSGFGSHEHIARVRIGARVPAFTLSRQTVVNDLRQPGGDRYYTDAGGTRANVVVVTCPSCTFKDYLRTDPDKTTSNNLLSLPRV